MFSWLTKFDFLRWKSRLAFGKENRVNASEADRYRRFKTPSVWNMEGAM